jgi:hypothetical protein
VPHVLGAQCSVHVHDSTRCHMYWKTTALVRTPYPHASSAVLHLCVHFADKKKATSSSKDDSKKRTSDKTSDKTPDKKSSSKRWVPPTSTPRSLAPWFASCTLIWFHALPDHDERLNPTYPTPGPVFHCAGMATVLRTHPPPLDGAAARSEPPARVVPAARSV